jgi:alkanesulfonate monooxygenase SsuD/methylene tetrahydromethanopterin reductase-like flavin-dependent oxidoreductase (luciferase family)
LTTLLLSKRLVEALEVILRAWTSAPFSHRGTYYEFDEVEVWPRPQHRARLRFGLGEDGVYLLHRAPRRGTDAAVVVSDRGGRGANNAPTAVLSKTYHARHGHSGERN